MAKKYIKLLHGPLEGEILERILLPPRKECPLKQEKKSKVKLMISKLFSKN